MGLHATLFASLFDYFTTQLILIISRAEVLLCISITDKISVKIFPAIRLGSFSKEISTEGEVTTVIVMLVLFLKSVSVKVLFVPLTV